MIGALSLSGREDARTGRCTDPAPHRPVFGAPMPTTVRSLPTAKRHQHFRGERCHDTGVQRAATSTDVPINRPVPQRRGEQAPVGDCRSRSLWGCFRPTVPVRESTMMTDSWTSVIVTVRPPPSDWISQKVLYLEPRHRERRQHSVSPGSGARLLTYRAQRGALGSLCRVSTP